MAQRDQQASAGAEAQHSMSSAPTPASRRNGAQQLQRSWLASTIGAAAQRDQQARQGADVRPQCVQQHPSSHADAMAHSNHTTRPKHVSVHGGAHNEILSLHPNPIAHATCATHLTPDRESLGASLCQASRLPTVCQVRQGVPALLTSPPCRTVTPDHTLPSNLSAAGPSPTADHPSHAPPCRPPEKQPFASYHPGVGASAGGSARHVTRSSDTQWDQVSLVWRMGMRGGGWGVVT